MALLLPKQPVCVEKTEGSITTLSAPMTGRGRLCPSPAFQREMGMERFSLHTHFIYRKLKLSPTSSETLFRRQDSSSIESEISPISRISSETPCGDLRVGSVRAEISPSSPTSSEALCSGQSYGSVRSEISPSSSTSSETPCGDLRVGSVRAEISPSSPTSSEALCSGQSSGSVRSEISPASRAYSDAPCGELGAGSAASGISSASHTSSGSACQVSLIWGKSEVRRGRGGGASMRFFRLTTRFGHTTR